jgi:hypothetical protein
VTKINFNDLALSKVSNAFSSEWKLYSLGMFFFYHSFTIFNDAVYVMVVFPINFIGDQCD